MLAASGGRVQIVSAFPPASEVFLIASSTWKPTHCPSGEKNGLSAPTVSGITTAAICPSGRRYSSLCPSRTPTKTKVWPSGESAPKRSVLVSSTPAGNVTASASREAGSAAGRRVHTDKPATIAPIASPAASGSIPRRAGASPRAGAAEVRNGCSSSSSIWSTPSTTSRTRRLESVSRHRRNSR